MENKSDIEKSKDIFNSMEKLLTSRKYDEAKLFMQSYNREDANVADLKMILIVSKAFKQHPVLAEPRKALLDLIEKKLGTKLI